MLFFQPWGKREIGKSYIQYQKSILHILTFYKCFFGVTWPSFVPIYLYNFIVKIYLNRNDKFPSFTYIFNCSYVHTSKAILAYKKSLQIKNVPYFVFFKSFHVTLIYNLFKSVLHTPKWKNNRKKLFLF